MTDTTATAARPSWLTHPVHAWRAYQTALADRADADAFAAGLTVELSPNGVRRYRDPRLDGLAKHRTRHAATRNHAAVDVAAWSPARLVTARGWSR
jgi:hypothetical protein